MCHLSLGLCRLVPLRPNFVVVCLCIHLAHVGTVPPLFSVSSITFLFVHPFFY